MNPTPPGLANIRHSRKQALIPIFVVGIVVAGYFLVWPKFQSLQEAKDVLASKQSELSDRESALQKIRQLTAELDSKKGDLTIVEDTLPRAPRVPELLATFDYLALQSGLLIDNLTLSMPFEDTAKDQTAKKDVRIEKLKSSTKNLAIIVVDATFSGEYQNLKNFLINLESNLRLMDIDQMTFESGLEEEQESSTREFNMKIHTYYEKN